jgi:hypothetical protein
MCSHTALGRSSSVAKKALISAERRHYLHSFYVAFVHGAQLNRVSNEPLPNHGGQYDKDSNASARAGRTSDESKIPGIQLVRKCGGDGDIGTLMQSRRWHQ